MEESGHGSELMKYSEARCHGGDAREIGDREDGNGPEIVEVMVVVRS